MAVFRLAILICNLTIFRAVVSFIICLRWTAELFLTQLFFICHKVTFYKVAVSIKICNNSAKRGRAIFVNRKCFTLPSMQHWVLCYWGLTNKHQLKAKPGISFGLTSIFELLCKQWTFNYKFTSGYGQTVVNIPTAQSPARCMQGKEWTSGFQKIVAWQFSFPKNFAVRMFHCFG